jgi:hypothetical protein
VLRGILAHEPCRPASLNSHRMEGSGWVPRK